ncbi:hypothetical protein BT96DRAFT_442422 [Gymnopus androsaceus JB14]|uniref:Uncharacterized protein n=1 Tax=Gymnopus androsaceus JB14 TaxID=1447944 RepID=A0A6A4GSW0_9AGAR|nr:hypothetical protein BT96DRAFT_442422 [Gymnopus androsaceus JB14]
MSRDRSFRVDVKFRENMHYKSERMGEKKAQNMDRDMRRTGKNKLKLPTYIAYQVSTMCINIPVIIFSGDFGS